MRDAVLQSRVLVERTTMRPSASEDIHVVIDVMASGTAVENKRPRLSVMFCIDASASMTGEPLAQAAASVGLIVDLLDDQDEVGLVAFASEASLISEMSTLNRAARAMLRRRASAIQPSGNSNIEAGLRTALRAFTGRADDVRQVLVLLSDGEPTRGLKSGELLSQFIDASRAQVGVVALGYGSAHNAEVLHRIARAGGGQFCFIPDPSEARAAFARALGAQGDVVAEQSKIVLMPADGVEIVEVLNVDKTRYTRDGLHVPVPDLRDGQNHKVVARLHVKAPFDNGSFPLVNVIVRHRPAGTRALHEERLLPHFGIADREPVEVVEAVHAVLLAQAEQVRAKARAEAGVGRFDGAARLLRGVLERLQKAEGYVVNDGSPLSEAVEHIVDEVTAYERHPSANETVEFNATARGVVVAKGSNHAADVVDHSRIAVRLQQATISAPPIGTLIVLDQRGYELGRVPLAGELIIGRAAGNDVVLPRGNISRRHTRVVVREGKALVIDLKTTNGTYVNGLRVQSPITLAPNDKIFIGEFALRFDPLESGTPSTPLHSGSLAPRDAATAADSFEARSSTPSPALEIDARVACALVVVETMTGRTVQRYTLPHDEDVYVGRESGACRIVLPGPDVEERHTRFVARGDTVYVTDMHSHRGTFLNGERIFEALRLCPGDVVTIGAYTLRFEGLRNPSDLMCAHDKPHANKNGVRGVANLGTLVVMLNGKQQHLVDMPAPGEIYIGRRSDRELILHSKPFGVPNLLARIVSPRGPAFVLPEGQTATVARNGVPLTKRLPLEFGDVLSVGNFRVQLVEHPPAAEGSPPMPTTHPASSTPLLARVSPGVLIVNDPQGNVSARVTLPAQGEVSIGRASSNDISLPMCGVALQHARVVVRDGTVIAVDLGSPSGTVVQGTRLKGPRILLDGHEMCIASFVMRFDRAAPVVDVSAQKEASRGHKQP